MSKRFLCTILVAVAAAVTVSLGSASAGGWAGSSYDRSDCQVARVEEGSMLTCSKWIVSVAQTTQSFLRADEFCANGIRLIDQTGTLETRFRRFDLFRGPVPHAKFSVGGNEEAFSERWLDLTETDRGCA